MINQAGGGNVTVLVTIHGVHAWRMQRLSALDQRRFASMRVHGQPLREYVGFWM
jgi:hypothetical protein